MNFISSPYRFIKSVLKQVVNYLIYFNKTSGNYKIREEGPTAIVNLDIRLMTADYGRYSYILCIYLKYCGFNVIVKMDPAFFRNIQTYQKLLLNQKYCLIRKSSTLINTVLLTGRKNGDKLIKINYGYNTIKSRTSDCIAPYPMHPLHYQPFSDLKNICSLSKTKRTIKIFFSGNVDKNLYNKETLKKEFKVLSRYEVIDFIETTFKENGKIQTVADKAGLYNLIDSQSYINSIIIPKVTIAATDWFKMLSKVDFFICAPGVGAPWCHNCIEVMSVGTIPILQYANLFTPALEHKKNCLVYTNYNDLQKVLELALEMKETEIETMRNNVLEYYHSYLSIESIAKKVETFCNSNKSETVVTIPFIRSNEEKSNIYLSSLLEKPLLVT